MIYLDNAGTTKPDMEVLKRMNEFALRYYYNPSSAYKHAAFVKGAVEDSRKKIKDAINAGDGSIIFTSGGTESDNLALKGAAKANIRKGKHIIVSEIEHKAVLNSAAALEREGFEVSYLGVNKDGIVDIDELNKLIRKDTTVISVMYANNETGVIQPVSEIGDIAHKNGSIFMCDAVQAVGNIPVDVRQCGIDLLSASSHKFNGPKGAGFLYASNPEYIMPCIDGGGQEMGFRSGTENTSGIYGMSLALEKSIYKMREKIINKIKIRDYIIGRLCKEIDGAYINGSISERLPNNINISFIGINGAALVLLLDDMGIMVSAGSACSAHGGAASHVLTAMGIEDELLHGTIRITTSVNTNFNEAVITVNSIKKAVNYLRRTNSSI